MPRYATSCVSVLHVGSIRQRGQRQTGLPHVESRLRQRAVFLATAIRNRSWVAAGGSEVLISQSVLLEGICRESLTLGCFGKWVVYSHRKKQRANAPDCGPPITTGNEVVADHRW